MSSVFSKKAAFATFSIIVHRLFKDETEIAGMCFVVVVGRMRDNVLGLTTSNKSKQKKKNAHRSRSPLSIFLPMSVL
jgi:hypothetical protein